LQATGRAEAAIVELKRSLGLPVDTSIKLRDTLEALARISESGETRDPRERPDVRQADAEVQLETARIRRAQADGRYDVSLFGSYMRMDAGFSQRGFGVGGDLERVRGVFHYASGGAMVMLPLWNRNQGAIAAARAGQTAAAARLDAALLAAQAEAAAAAAQAAQTFQALGIMANGVVLARRNVEVVRQTYELGRATLPEVLTEQRRYLEFENEYTSALRAAFEARVASEFARGEVK
jgi:cobalt-zinc-cadmium efflux system outer membrane protein